MLCFFSVVVLKKGQVYDSMQTRKPGWAGDYFITGEKIRTLCKKQKVKAKYNEKLVSKTKHIIVLNIYIIVTEQKSSLQITSAKNWNNKKHYGICNPRWWLLYY